MIYFAFNYYLYPPHLVLSLPNLVETAAFGNAVEVAVMEHPSQATGIPKGTGAQWGGGEKGGTSHSVAFVHNVKYLQRFPSDGFTEAVFIWQYHVNT